MEMDIAPVSLPSSRPVVSVLESAIAEVRSDGLLLYVAQASYEPGTNPLSSWIPIAGYGQRTPDTVAESRLGLFER